MSKFHLYAVDCDSRAIAFCIANVTYPPPPGDDLPKMPCIPTSSRKKRESGNGNCNPSNGECVSVEPNEGGNRILYPNCSQILMNYSTTSFHVHRNHFVYSGIQREFFIPEEYSRCNSPHGCSWEASKQICDTVGDGLAPTSESRSTNKNPLSSFLNKQDNRRFMFYIMVFLENSFVWRHQILF